MVQMGDVHAVDRCFNSLNKTILFGNELQISYSKQAFLHDVMQPFSLPDGSPSFKDFMGNKNNRFRNPEVASKNRILPPSRVLHFFNAPFGISEDELIVLFKQTTNYEPNSLKIFPPKGELIDLYFMEIHLFHN
jgi:heterogeneous nuclear ribonucleoprotein L